MALTPVTKFESDSCTISERLRYLRFLQYWNNLNVGTGCNQIQT